MNALPPDEFLLSDPALAPLLGALTTGPTLDELAGQHAALAMYRAVRAAGPHAARLRGPAHVAGGWARVTGGRARRGALAAVTSFAVLAGGFAAAGYLAVLPAPLQHAVHQWLGFPDARGGAVAAQGGRGRPLHAGNARHSVRPGPTPPGKAGTPQMQHQSSMGLGTRLTAWAAPSGPMVAGGQVVITATLTDDGEPVHGSEVRLLERAAGQPRWQQATLARTGPDGTAALRVPSLTTNARFLVTTPGRVRSQSFAVVVLPPVSLRLRAGKHGKRGVVLVRCRFAAPGDVVWLQVRQDSRWHTGGDWPSARWQTEEAGRLSKHGKASFEITDIDVGLAYRVVVLATAMHGRSVSTVIVFTVRDLLWRP